MWWQAIMPHSSPSIKIGMVNDAATPMLARYSVYMTDAPRSAQYVMFSGWPVSGLASGVISTSGPAALGTGRIQMRW